jgi:Protein of unknown function (DUF3251)
MRAILFPIIIGLATTVAVAQRRPANTSNAPDVAALEKRLKALESKVYALEYKLDKDNSVELDTSSDVYQRVNSNNGSFLVRVMKAEPYLNGYKVFLAIGNTTTATFSGFDLTFKWGMAEPSPGEFSKWLAWFNSLNKKTQSFLQDLEPGTWNQVEVILTPTRKDELGYLELSMTTSAVVLRSR